MVKKNQKITDIKLNLMLLFKHELKQTGQNKKIAKYSKHIVVLLGILILVIKQFGGFSLFALKT